MDLVRALSSMIRWPKLLYAGLTTVILFAFFSHWAYDDPFITFRYADNLRSGLGFVYNPGERVLSTTTPLYALLLAGSSYLWPNLPCSSNLISAFSLALGGLFLYLIGQAWKEPLAGLVAALLFPFFPLMVSTFGAETCFYVMLSLGAFAFYARDQYHWAMALAALATLTRTDGVLVAAILGLDYFIRQRRIPWRPLLLYVLLITPWYIFSWGYFGSPFPVTLAAKQHQGQMAISDSFAYGFLRLLKGYGKHPIYWLQGGLALVGAGYALLRARRWLPLLSWGVLYFLSYVILGVSRYFWYYAPLVPVFLAAVGLGVAAIWQGFLPVLTGKRRYVGAGALVILLAAFFWRQGKGLYYIYHHPDKRVDIYRQVGTWLDENTPPEASVGTLEVGIIGYYAHRRMIGFAGLIQPDVARQMGEETTYQDTTLWAVQHYHPDYLVMRPGEASAYGLVSEHCFPQQVFVSEEYQSELAVYGCDWAR